MRQPQHKSRPIKRRKMGSRDLYGSSEYETWNLSCVLSGPCLLWDGMLLFPSPIHGSRRNGSNTVWALLKYANASFSFILRKRFHVPISHRLLNSVQKESRIIFLSLPRRAIYLIHPLKLIAECQIFVSFRSRSSACLQFGDNVELNLWIKRAGNADIEIAEKGFSESSTLIHTQFSRSECE